jgi:hypothetical protein
LSVSFEVYPEFYNNFDVFLGFHHFDHTGIIAQDIRKILPDAVSSSGPYMLSSGEEIDDMLIVNKDRLFLGKLTEVACKPRRL